jgi:carbon-monoxide dehydrogenase small subunit
MKKSINITVNNKPYKLSVEPNQTLLEILRIQWGLTGAKVGCNMGDCGACTVIMDGKPVNSCLVLAVQANGRNILTIEGVETEQGIHPLQQAFIDKGAIQCGFCTPGIILSAKSLLENNPEANEKEIREAISGNLCRCTGYQKIVEAIQSVSEKNSYKFPSLGGRG